MEKITIKFKNNWSCANKDNTVPHDNIPCDCLGVCHGELCGRCCDPPDLFRPPSQEYKKLKQIADTMRENVDYEFIIINNDTVGIYDPVEDLIVNTWKFKNKKIENKECE